jgi:phage FluMu gp28-like protein
VGILLPYQRRWVDDKARFKIGMFARQTGKTFSTTLEIAEDVLEAEATGRRVRWVILSRGERQAKEAMNEGVKLHLRALGAAYEELEYEFPLSDGTRVAALEIATRGGSVVTALPANADTARGFSANVFLDEFAFHQDSRAIWAALFPVISKPGLKLRITSTPNGKGNKFYELMTGKDSQWSRHTVDIYQAVADGLERNIDDLRVALGDEDIWQQEFELKWAEAASAWLGYEVIAGCEHPEAGLPELYQGGLCFFGNDIARRRHLWVCWVWELVGDVLWTREISELRNASFAEQDQEIARLHGVYHMTRLVMDQTGMGEKPVEDMQRLYGAAHVEGVIMAGARPLTIATVARQAFEEKRVRIPAGNAVLRADLHKIKKVIGPTGAPRLVADQDGEGHADRAWASFLGIAGADMSTAPPAGASVNNENQRARGHRPRMFGRAGRLHA